MEGAGPADKLSPRHGPAENRSQEYIKPAHPSDMSGPTPWSNWIVPQQVVAGGYPCCFEDIDNDRLLNMLLFELGIETFVCLQVCSLSLSPRLKCILKFNQISHNL